MHTSSIGIKRKCEAVCLALLDRTAVNDPLSAANGSWFPVAVKKIKVAAVKGRNHEGFLIRIDGFYLTMINMSRW
jgi:hypothetical protein